MQVSWCVEKLLFNDSQHVAEFVGSLELEVKIVDGEECVCCSKVGSIAVVDSPYT